jgi:hypothetical protein
MSPSARHDGSPFLPEERELRVASNVHLPRAALLQIRGDWEWLQTAFRLRATGADSFCWMCNATRWTRGPMHFSDFRAQAAHRQSVFTHEQYLLACAREQAEPSVLFRCPGLRIEHLTVDVMHAGDLGTFQDAIGVSVDKTTPSLGHTCCACTGITAIGSFD